MRDSTTNCLRVLLQEPQFFGTTDFGTVAPPTFPTGCGLCRTWSISLREPCLLWVSWIGTQCRGRFGGIFLPSRSTFHDTLWPRLKSPSRGSTNTLQRRFSRSCPSCDSSIETSSPRRKMAKGCGGTLIPGRNRAVVESASRTAERRRK